jgi:ATP-dependent Clp protease ATP-binding subunit ClpA
MIQPNPEIEVIIESAAQSAKKFNHEYVTLEHLLLALINYEPFGTLLYNFGSDNENLCKDLEDYLTAQTFLTSKKTNVVPRKTHALERVFNRAFTQVLFSGRSHMQIIDLFISLYAEANSHATYFLLKY